MAAAWNLQVILALLLGAFLFAESLGAIWKITRHHSPLYVSQYFFAAFAGLWLCINALIGDTSWLEIAEAAALSAFVARQLLWRLGHASPDISATHQNNEP